MVTHFTDESALAAINSNGPVVIDFWAEWCGPCLKLGPLVEELAEKYGDRVNVGKLDIEEGNEVPAMFSVRNIPTVLFIKDGQVKEKTVGFVSFSELEKKIQSIL